MFRGIPRLRVTKWACVRHILLPADHSVKLRRIALPSADAPWIIPSPEAPHDAMTETLILFTLDGNQFALDALKVERVVRSAEITPLPELPAGVRGVIGV